MLTAHDNHNNQKHIYMKKRKTHFNKFHPHSCRIAARPKCKNMRCVRFRNGLRDYFRGSLVECHELLTYLLLTLMPCWLLLLFFV